MSADAVKPTDSPIGSGLRIAVWGFLAALAIVSQARSWIDVFRPAPGAMWDFSQEWLSARNYWTGQPVYSPQHKTLVQHTGMKPQGPYLQFDWNAHPPVAILLALPFGRLSYPDAHQAWNIAMSVLLLWALLLAIRLREAPFRVDHLLALVTLLAFCHPLLLQMKYGQLNGFLVFLLVAAWWADRRQYQYLAGACIGAAAAIKLLPAFLFIYWLMQGRWRALLGGAGAFVLLNSLAWAVLDPGAFGAYIFTAVPSINHFQGSWLNMSLPGLWVKLFNPEPSENVVPLLRAPALAQVLVIASQVVVVVLTAIRCRQAHTREQRDRALGLAVVGMLLVSPITWSHYLLMLLMPLAVRRATPTWRLTQAAWYVCLFVCWVPMIWLLHLAWPGSRSLNPPSTAHPWVTLTLLSLPTYALVFLFYQYWRSSPATSSAGDAPGPALVRSPLA